MSVQLDHLDLSTGTGTMVMTHDRVEVPDGVYVHVMNDTYGLLRFLSGGRGMVLKVHPDGALAKRLSEVLDGRGLTGRKVEEIEWWAVNVDDRGSYTKMQTYAFTVGSGLAVSLSGVGGDVQLGRNEGMAVHLP